MFIISITSEEELGHGGLNNSHASDQWTIEPDYLEFSAYGTHGRILIVTNDYGIGMSSALPMLGEQ